MMVCVLFNIICPFITTVCAITQDTAQHEAHVGWNLHSCKAIRYIDGVGMPYPSKSSVNILLISLHIQWFLSFFILLVKRIITYSDEI